MAMIYANMNHGRQKMRLIDANNLKLGLCEECKLYPDKCLKDNCDWNSIYHIKIEPTVDAIPIEWIENKIADIKKRPDDDYSISDCYELRISEVWLWLLEFWKEENQ